MSRRGRRRPGSEGGRGDASYGGGVGNSSTNYAPSVGTPSGRMNARPGSTQIAGAPASVSMGNPNTLRGTGTPPSFPGGMKMGQPPGIPAVNGVKMVQVAGAGGNVGGANQPGGAGSGGGKGKPWANFTRVGRGGPTHGGQP